MSKTDTATMRAWTARQRLMRKKARKACKQAKHKGKELIDSSPLIYCPPSR